MVTEELDWEGNPGLGKMELTQIINMVMVCFLVLGAADYILDGRFGIKNEFEEGILTSGHLTFCMAGFMVLAPVLARLLEMGLSPLCRLAGLDPSVVAGMFLANDAGGAVLAMELADSAEAGLFNGLIVGSMLGTTVMLVIPSLMILTRKEERPPVIYGLLCGLATVPLGCFIGGTAAGFPTALVVKNTVPVLFVSLAILASLLILRDKIIRIFSGFGKLMTSVAILGLLLGAADSFLGIQLVPGTGKLEEAFPIIGNISIFLAGAFPAIAVIRKVFGKAIERAGGFFHTNSCGVSALILSLANSLAAIMLLHDMDERGRFLNVAFLVSAGCALGDHMAYTGQVAPELCAAVMTGKLVGGVTALCLAMAVMPRLFACQDKQLSQNSVSV